MTLRQHSAPELPTRRANHQILSSPFTKNILIFRRSKSVYNPRRPAPLGEPLAIVTDVGRDAVDAEGATDESTRGERRRRVVLMPRCWHQASRRYPLGDGGKKAGHRGEHVISRKAIAQGRPECFR